MTAFAVAVQSRQAAIDSGSSLVTGTSEYPLPCFTLRKRKAAVERETTVYIPSVNSALLDGLFADVAEIQHSCEESCAEAEETGSYLEVAPATKKSRSSLTHSISRSNKSFRWLGEALFPSVSDFSSQAACRGSPADDLTRQVTPGSSGSLQSNCSHSPAMVGCPKLPSLTNGCVESLSFPHLPTTVSVSCSCSTLTRVNSDLQSSNAESEEKESYGWFVEMDGGNVKEIVDPYRKTSSSQQLAFVVPTAPLADDYDAEVEWAKAADTVDSVLGDFF